MKFIYDNGLNIDGNIQIPIQSIVSGTDSADHTDFDNLDINGGLTINGDRRVLWNTNPLPIGAIIFWDTTISTIPSGWAVCDGNGGTPINGITIPNLQDKFIMGVGAGYNINVSSGADSVTLNATHMPNHTHGSTITTNSDGVHTHTINKPRTTGNDEPGANWGLEGSTGTGIILASSAGGSDHTHTFTSSSAGGTASPTPHENRPPYYALLLIIRTAVA